MIKKVKILITTITVIWCITNSLTAFSFFTDYAKKSPHETISLLEKKQAEDPHNPQINYNLGVALYKAGIFDTARKNFERVIVQHTIDQTLRNHATFNAGDCAYKNTLSILGPDWEKKEEISLETLDKALTEIKDGIKHFKDFLKNIPESEQATHNIRQSETLQKKLEKKRTEQEKKQQQKKEEKQDQQKDQNKEQQQNKKNQENKQDKQQQEYQNQKKEKQENQQNQNQSQEQEKKQQDQRRSENTEQQDQGEQKSNQQEQIQQQEHGQQNKNHQEKAQQKQPDMHQEAANKKEPEERKDPQSGSASEQDQQAAKDGSQDSPTATHNEKQQVMTATQSGEEKNLEKREFKALLQNLQNDESALQKGLIHRQLQQQNPRQRQGQKPW